MNAYTAFRSCVVFGFLAVFISAVWVVSIVTIVGEVGREIGVHNRAGAGWKKEYEKQFGSLSKARTSVGVCVVGSVAIPALATWLYRGIRPKSSSGRSREHSRHRLRHWIRSRFGGFRHYRRNGTVAIIIGVFGILVAAFLTMFRIGIFEDPSNETLLAMGVFLPSYACVLTGCSWWLKAKGWNEAIIAIGMMPLAILFVPFVRLIFLAVPMVLVISMLMMPLVLVVVVIALPDKTRPFRRRSHRHRAAL